MKRILLLPGLGDVHWVFLKLQSWLKRMGPEWENPEVSIWNIDNRPRTLEYFQFVPWVKPGGYVDIPLVGKDKLKFNSLYQHLNDGDVLFNFHGFDAFIGTNGNMRNGKPFRDILGGAEINYEYGPVLPPHEFGERERERGPYFVLGFSGFGMFEHSWCPKMTAENIKDLVKGLKTQFPGYRFVFTGCSWDDAFSRQCVGEGDVALVGKTTLPEFFSLLRHSSGYLGWCGGNSILAQHLGIPTVVWWSRIYFPKHDREGWQTLGPRGPHQLVLEVEDFELEDCIWRIDGFFRDALQRDPECDYPECDEPPGFWTGLKGEVGKQSCPFHLESLREDGWDVVSLEEGSDES